MQEVLGKKAEEIGQQVGFVKRARKLSGASFAQSLVYGWLANEAASLKELSQSTYNVGAGVSRQALDKRFTAAAAALMEGLATESIGTVVAGTVDETPLVNQFNGVYVMDSTVVTLPDTLSEYWVGVQGSAVKLSVCWELQTGRLPVIHLHDASEHDQKAPRPIEDMEPGALWLADLGYFKLDSLQTFQSREIYWISRYKTGTVIEDEQGHDLSLSTLIQSLPGTRAHRIAIRLGRRHQIPCRLMVRRLAPQTRARRERQLQEYERKKQTTASAERRLYCGYDIYITTVPDDVLSPDEVLRVARVRWQIELLFKLWKNDLHIDEWRTSNPYRILCEFYAKLIAAIIQHWLFLMSNVHHLDYSMFQARTSIANLIWGIARVIYDTTALTDALAHLRTVLQGCRVTSSRTRPSTFKQLAA